MSRAAARKPAAKTRAVSPLRHQPSRSRVKAAPKAKARKAPPKPRAKAPPKPRAKAKPKARAPRSVEPVTFRLSRLPQPANRQSRSIAGSGTLAFGGLGWLLAGGALLWALTRKAGDAPSATLPPAPVTPPAPKPQEPPVPKPPVADPNASDREKLAIEYRRAKLAEIPRDVLVRAPSFLKFDMGTVHFFPAQDGREFAAALEEHFHSPESGLKPVGKHKGVSMFIKRTA
jgi:hypothetical protein